MKRFHMKKGLVLCVLWLITVTCLTGYNLSQNIVEKHYRHYEQQDAERITEKGTEMMQMWLEEKMPGAKITECSAFIQNITYSGHEYLTDYAVGRIRLGDEETVFSIDTVTGDVYFENVQSVQESLNEIAASYLYETMEIMPGGGDDFFKCYVLAPFREENHELRAYQFNYGFDFGLPAGVEDLEDFVYNSASRPLLYVQTAITVSDETDLAAYDFSLFEKLSEECGMFFTSISIENKWLSHQFLTRRKIATDRIIGHLPHNGYT